MESSTVRQMLIVFMPACYQHSGACAIVRGSKVDPRLAIDELLKDCLGAIWEAGLTRSVAAFNQCPWANMLWRDLFGPDKSFKIRIAWSRERV